MLRRCKSNHYPVYVPLTLRTPLTDPFHTAGGPHTISEKGDDWETRSVSARARLERTPSRADSLAWLW